MVEPPLFWTPGVNSFRITLWAKSFSVDAALGSDERSRNNIRSRSMSSRAAMMLATWLSMTEVVLTFPLLVVAIASSIADLGTDIQTALATLMEYYAAFAEYLKLTRVLWTGSSMGK